MDGKFPIASKLWKQIPAAIQAVLLEALRRLWEKIDRLQGRNQELERQVQQLAQQVQTLQERLGKNSSNSSKPPSTDGPHVKRAPPQPRSRRKRGGQPGHAQRQRTLVPTQDCQEVIPVKPSACRGCGARLTGDDPAPRRHQVWEVPPVQPEVREFRIHSLVCSGCGQRTCGQLPTGVPSGQFGPRLISWVALLMGVYRLSKRQAQQLGQDVWGLPISLGQICRLQEHTRQVLDPVVQEAREYVPGEPANVDETRWVENKTRCWLWVAVTQWVTVYLIRATRGADVLWEILGETYAEVVTSDRAKAYDTLPLSQRQLCWAHLRRDFQAMIDRRNAGAKLGESLLFLADLMLSAWAKVRAGKRTRRWFVGLLEDFVRQDVHLLLEQGAACRCSKTAATCRELLTREEALWTFAYAEGVEPTNNAGERAALPPVQYRKTSFGTDSPCGSRFLENIFTVAASCRPPSRNIWEYLTTCHQLHLLGQPLPSLLPKGAET